MADKPEFVDMISEATRQVRRKLPRIVDLNPVAPKDTRRLSNWPPEHWLLPPLMPPGLRSRSPTL